MTRLSRNQYRDGRVWTGFDYALQVWVLEGIVQPCGHPEAMRAASRPCCPAFTLAGRRITEVDGAEARWCAACRTPAGPACTSHLHALR